MSKPFWAHVTHPSGIRPTTRRTLMKLLLAVFIGAALWTGLNPRDFHFPNRASWLPDRPGLAFQKHAIAYAPIAWPTGSGPREAPPLALELAIQPRIPASGGFSTILGVSTGDEGTQLLVGQWRSHLVVMNGDDYENARREPRINIDMAARRNEWIFLTITSGPTATRLYVDGRLIRTHRQLTLTMPPGERQWLTLGNSVFGKQPWSGRMGAVALHDRLLSARTVENRFAAWQRGGALPVPGEDRPRHLYLFRAGHGRTVPDHGLGRQNLRLPRRFKILHKRFLTPPWKQFKPGRPFFGDFLINLLGFVPLGLMLFLVLNGSSGVSGRQAFWYTAAVGLGLSLVIETVQAGLPSRSSDLHDLLLNTAGASLGALAGLTLQKRCQIRARP